MSPFCTKSVRLKYASGHAATQCCPLCCTDTRLYVRVLLRTAVQCRQYTAVRRAVPVRRPVPAPVYSVAVALYATVYLYIIYNIPYLQLFLNIII